VLNWQQTRSDFGYKTIAIYVCILLWICRQCVLTSYASRLVTETEQGPLESGSVLNLLSICRQIMHDFSGVTCLAGFVIFLTAICGQYLNTNCVYNLLPFCNKTLLGDSAQNLSPQALLSEIYRINNFVHFEYHSYF